MFRFTTGDEESPRAGPRTDSPYRLSPVGRDSALTGALSSPKRAPMRIARSPFKVGLLAVHALRHTSLCSTRPEPDAIACLPFEVRCVQKDTQS